MEGIFGVGHMWLATLLAILIALSMPGVMWLYRRMEQRMTKLIRQRNARLQLVLGSSGVRIWLYDLAKRQYTWLDRNGQEAGTFDSGDVAQRYTPENFSRLHEAMEALTQGRTQDETLNVQEYDRQDGSLHDYLLTLSVLRKSQGRPSVIIGTKRDLTEKRQKQYRAKALMTRYQTVFNTAMTDMMYFDSHGVLTDINDKGCQSFGMTKEQLLAERLTVQDVLGMEDLKTAELDDFYATIRPPKTRSVTYQHYEMKLVPVFDGAHRLMGIFGTGRDVTEYVRSYHKLRDGLARLDTANKAVKTYVDNINYALKVGGVRLANYSPATHTMQIFNEIDHALYTLTQSRLLRLCAQPWQDKGSRLLGMMDARTRHSVSAEIKSVIKRHDGHHLFLSLHFIPTYDEDGNVTGYFGLCRDISDLKLTERQLQQETAKAQEIETVKNAFLRNMSYEIRTPLNAVVGFAELFEDDHPAEDEGIFVEEIKANSKRLLALINDILFLSRLDARMIEINKAPIDFAAVFEAKCQAGWQHLQHQGVDYSIENPYEKLVVEIDEQNLGLVIEQIVKNAAQNTLRGRVRARYSYMGERLIVAVEDTGNGIGSDVLAHVFERFASSSAGTGLGLAICHELTEQMGGTIEISSTPGKGTAVWVTIPCKAVETIRK